MKISIFYAYGNDNRDMINNKRWSIFIHYMGYIHKLLVLSNRFLRVVVEMCDETYLTTFVHWFLELSAKSRAIHLKIAILVTFAR